MQGMLFNNTGRDAVLGEVDDITANKHHSHPASVAANETVDKSRDRKRVLDFIRLRGVTHSKEIARGLDKPLNLVSGRISELKKAGVIQETGEREDGCALLCLR